MCSCSGNCNCNSSTIPRGPQGLPGPTGPQGIQGIQGLPGNDGTPGINGKNAYTLTADVVDQPDFGDTAYFEVSDTSWMSVNQIIFVGNPTGTSNIGGYYKVTSITSSFNFTAERLDWSIPGVTYVSTGGTITAPAIVQSSGTIGATGPAAVQRIINDQLADGIGVTASLDVNITQLNLNGEFITFNVVWSTAEASDILNSIYFRLNNVTSPSLFYASSQDFSNAGLQNALIKYDRDPNLNPTGYPNDQELNSIRGDFKITRTSSSTVRVIATIYGHNSNQQNFGISTHPQKIWTMTSNRNVGDASNFTINIIATGDGENVVQMYDILKYSTPNI